MHLRLLDRINHGYRDLEPVVVGLLATQKSFMLIGRHVSRLAWYAVLGMFAASLGQVVGTAIQAPEPLKIGDVNVLAASVGACSVVLTARLRGL